MGTIAGGRDRIQKILGNKGFLSRCIDNYENRPQQMRMAEEVYRALIEDDNLIIEAPTGTGKTLAYLIPAILSRKRTAISTGTKNLQEQIFFKDIPFLQKHLFPDLKVSLLKGRANFICHSRLSHFLRQPYLTALGLNEQVNGLLEWYEHTKKYGEGDRAELPDLPDDDPIWPEICAGTETCIGKKCSYREEDCFITKMRMRAQDSDLMIVNHHLLCSDIVVKDMEYGFVIPRYEGIILDEAHGLEDVATQHFGFHLNAYKTSRLVKDIRSELQSSNLKPEKYLKSIDHIENGTRRIFEHFHHVAAAKASIGLLKPELVEAQETVATHLDILAATLDNARPSTDEIKQLVKRTSSISEEFKIILDPEPDGRYACWMEKRERYVHLHASPIDVGADLCRMLYSKVDAAVFTSATISSGGNFEYFKMRLGIPDKPIEVILDSPFDYKFQSLMYIPASAPDPNDAAFPKLVAPIIKELLMRSNGRAFVLFTSYKNMETVHHLLKNEIPFPTLLQGDKPKTKLLEEFQNVKGSVLFATSSFWEGVDVQGEALSCVIIDRLPFSPPNDPIISARIQKLKENGREPFFSFQVPMAVLALKQGLGRLIRTKTDRGILAILDTRIVQKSYGKMFLRSLHNSPITRDLDSIELFFRDCNQ